MKVLNIEVVPEVTWAWKPIAQAPFFTSKSRPSKHVGFGLAHSDLAVEVERQTDDSDFLGAYFVGAVEVPFNGFTPMQTSVPVVAELAVKTGPEHPKRNL